MYMMRPVRQMVPKDLVKASLVAVVTGLVTVPEPPLCAAMPEALKYQTPVTNETT